MKALRTDVPGGWDHTSLERNPYECGVRFCVEQAEACPAWLKGGFDTGDTT